MIDAGFCKFGQDDEELRIVFPGIRRGDRRIAECCRFLDEEGFIPELQEGSHVVGDQAVEQGEDRGKIVVGLAAYGSGTDEVRDPADTSEGKTDFFLDAVQSAVEIEVAEIGRITEIDQPAEEQGQFMNRIDLCVHACTAEGRSF